MATRNTASHRPASRAAAKPAANRKAAPPAAAVKSKKPKLVRDSFAMPKVEYEMIEELKRRTALQGQQAKKSELLRAGVKLLATLSSDALAAALAAVPSIKTGRPSQRGAAKAVAAKPAKPAPKLAGKPAAHAKAATVAKARRR